jgi:hypothetical protein
MSELRSEPTARHATSATPPGRETAEDLEALGRVTGRDVPTLDDTVRAVSHRPHSSPSRWEEYAMAMMDFLKRRPGLATAVAIAIAAVAMLVIPFSYQRTTGHDVALALSGGNLSMDQAREIAKELKGVLRVDHVTVDATNRNGRLGYVLNARVPARSSVNVVATASAFQAGLARVGEPASLAITPVKERVSGTVYAYAYDRVIEISMDGKTAPQLESEIQRRLSEAGITGASVSVTHPGGDPNGLEVKVESKHDRTTGEAPGQALEYFPELVLTKHGAPVAGQRFAVGIEKRHAADGVTLTVRVQQGDRTAAAEVPRSDSMSDASLATAIESQLKAAGLDVTVRVNAGEIEVRPRVEK